MLEAKKVSRKVCDYLVLTLSSFIFAFAWEGFMIPNGMSAGGMMGLCTVLQYATGGLIEASYSYIVINAVLIIIAVVVMGIGFGFKTIYAIVMSTVAMKLLAGMEWLHCVPGGVFYVKETLLIPALAGVLEALGIGLVLRYGGSTGGTDIIALMVNKYWPVNLSTVFLFSDFAVIALILFLPEKTFTDMVYGVVEVLAFTSTIDFVVGGRKSYQLLVFSSKHAEIADYICHELDRGVTVIKGMGWFTQKERDVLLIILDQKQFLPLSRAIKEMDPCAFMSVAPTHNVYGEGFSEIKAGVRLGMKKQKSNETSDQA
jgi:Uncharacterized conserved protein